MLAFLRPPVGLRTRRLNRRLVLRLAMIIAIAGLGMHFVHAFRTERHADAWLRQAHAARAAGNVGRCLDCLARYVGSRPTDTAAVKEYALLLAERAATPKAQWQALVTLDQVLVHDTYDEDARRKSAKICLSLGRIADARAHLEHLLAAAPNDADCEQALAQCLEALGDGRAAVTWYAKATGHAPHDFHALSRRAELLCRLKEDKPARETLDAMVAANAESPQAYVIRARFHRAAGRWKEMEADLRHAIDLAPHGADTLLTAVAWTRDSESRQRCDAGMRDLAAKSAKDPRIYRTLADREYRAGRFTEADAWLRQGLRVLPDQRDLLEALADLWLARGNVPEAKRIIERLDQLGSPLARARYWDARLLMSQGQWFEAERILKPTSDGWATKASQVPILLALGECYGHTDERARQCQVYRQAVALDPTSAAAQIGLGSALMHAGHMAEAIAVLREAARLPDASSDAMCALAEALVQQNQASDPARRDWSAIETLLKRADASAPASPRSARLRAATLFAQGKPHDAERLLLSTIATGTADVGTWITLADLAARRGDREAARATLEKAKDHFDGRIELRLAILQLALQKGGREAERAVQAMERGLDALPDSTRVALLREAVQVLARSGTAAQRERVARRLVRERPDDASAHVALIDALVQSGSDSEWAKESAALRALEGDQGMHWRFTEASRLLRHGDRKALEVGGHYLAELRRAWPESARVAVLQATWEERMGRPERALAAYQHALELGNREPRVAHRLAQMFFDRGRYAEAERAVRQFDGTPVFHGAFAKLAAEIAIANHDSATALKRARAAVNPRTRDYREQLWLAHVLDATDHAREAATVLRETAARHPRIFEVWQALIRHWIAQGLPAKAEAALREAESHLASRDVSLLRAQTFETLGRSTDAEREYRAALAVRPNDPIVLKAASRLFIAVKQEPDAKPLLRQIIDSAISASEPDARWARRQLALLVAARPGANGFDEALALLDKNNPQTADDQRARARVLAHRPSRHADAIRLLEESASMKPLPVDDRVLLAELYEAAGDRSKARAQWLVVLAEPKQRERFAHRYAETLTRWGEVREAERWLALQATRSRERPEGGVQEKQRP